MPRPTCTQSELDAFLNEQAQAQRAAFVVAFRARFLPNHPGGQGVVFKDAVRPDPFRAFLDTLPLALDVVEPVTGFVVIAYQPAPWHSDASPYPTSAVWTPGQPVPPASGCTILAERPVASDLRADALNEAELVGRDHPTAWVVVRRALAPCGEVARFAPVGDA